MKKNSLRLRRTLERWVRLFSLLPLVTLFALAMTVSASVRLQGETIKATKTDALFTDVDGDGLADAGDTLEYTVVITNSTGADVTGVVFNDTVDINTTVVPGSLHASPIAMSDAYDAVGNTLLRVGGSAGSEPELFVSGGSVRNNDTTLTDASSVVAIVNGATAQGGTVNLNSDGTFTYSPPVGYTGADTFTYTLRNSADTSLADTATVTITVSNRVWYVNSAAGTNGDGRSSSPFNTLSASTVNGAGGSGDVDGTGDYIYLFASGTNYTGGLVLESSQTLVGGGAALIVNGNVLKSAGSAPMLLNAGGNGLTLASNNMISGFNLGNSSGSAILGSSFGTLTVSAVSINTTGQALSLTTGTFSGSITSITSAGGTNNISLTGVTASGTANLGSGALSGASGASVLVSSGSGDIAYSGTIGKSSSGRIVDVQNRTSGTLTFGGAVTASSSSGGVYLNNNTGSTIAFSSGNLQLSTSTNNAFTAAGGGTVNVTGSNNTLTTTTGTAVSLNGVGGSLAFRSISANGGANGIVLQNTAGSFTVDGDGTNTALGGNSSGGTIQNMNGADGTTAGIGVYLNNVQNVTLRRMTINGTNQNYGIRGLTVNNFTLEYATVSGVNGTAASLLSPENAGEGSIYFGNYTTTGLTGSATVNRVNISGGRARNFSVINTSGTLNRLTVTGSNFGLNQNYADANQSLAVEARNSGTVANVTVRDSTFTGSPGDLVNFTNQIGSAMDVVFGGAGAGENNTLSNNHAQNVIGGGGMTLATGGTMTLNVTNNTFRDADGSAITLQLAAPLPGDTSATSLNGTLTGNTIGVSGVAGSGSRTGNGIFLSFADNTTNPKGQVTLAITNNTIRQYLGNAAIYADNTGGNYNADLTITGNTTDQPGAGVFAGLALTAGAPSSSDDIDVCANITGNNFSAGDPNDANDVILGGGASGASTLRLPGLVPSGDEAARQAQVQSFVLGNNNIAGTAVSAYVDSPATFASTFIGGAACSSPSASLVPSNDGQMLAQADVIEQVRAPRENVNEKAGSNLPLDFSKWFKQTTFVSRGDQPGFTLASYVPARPNLATLFEPLANLFAVRTAFAAPAERPNAAPDPVNIGTLPASKRVTIRFRATINADLPSNVTQVSNQGTVTFNTSQTIYTDDPDTLALGDATITQIPKPDLAVAKSDTPDPVTAGENITYTINLSNAGTAAAQAVTLTDAVPANTVFVSAQVLSGTGWSASTPAVGGTGNVVFSKATMATSESDAFQIVVKVNSNAAHGAIITNAATAATTSVDSNSSNDTGSATTTVQTRADLAMTKSDSPDPVWAGENITYAITFANNGPSEAQNVSITDAVPANATFVSAQVTSGSGWTTSTPAVGGTGNVVFSKSPVTVGETSAVQIVVKVNDDTGNGATISNSATAASDTTDPNGGNNTASAATTVRQPVIYISAGSTAPAEAGPTPGTFEITLTAAAPSIRVANYSLSGSAARPGDYILTAGANVVSIDSSTFTITAGATSAVVNIVPVNDLIDEDGETVQMTLAPGSGYVLGAPNDATQTITDNDTAGVTLSKTGVAVVEGGATDSYTAQLDTQPVNPVTVRITPTAQINLGAGAGVPINLTFAADLSAIQPQTVTVQAVDDAAVEGDHASSLSHGVSSADAKYNGIAFADVIATLTDNDLGYTISANQATVNEGNTGSTSITFTVQRTGAITTEAGSVDFFFSGAASLGSDYTKVAPSGYTLNWAAGAAQASLVLNVLGDEVDEDDETIDVTLSNPTASGTASILGSNPVSTTIVDDDTAGFTVSAISGDTGENGTQVTFTVRLNSRPSADVTISLGSSDLTEGTVTPTSLTFTALTWSVPQTATVTGVDDSVADGNIAYTVVTTADPTTTDTRYRGLDPADVAVTNLDNDIPRVNIVQSGGSTTATEGGSGDAYTVVLNSQPTDPVTITVTPDAQLNLGAGAGAPITLNFDAGNWNTPRTVNVSAFDDAAVEGDHSGSLSHSASSADPNYGAGASFVVDGVAGSSVTVTLTDNDVQYTLSANQATVTEGNTGTRPITFTVARTGDITRSSSVDWSLSGTAISGTDYIIGSSTIIAFGAGVTTQLVTLNVLGDYVDESDETIIVTLSNPTGTGGGGTGITSGSPATTTIQDDDTAGVSVNPITLTVSEPDTTNVFTISLNSQPESVVTITLISTDTTECSVPALAVLNSGNWQTGVGITVAAVDDSVSDGPQTCLVQTSAAGSNDANYDELPVADVTVTVNDDDVPGVILSKASASVGEGGPNDTYTVRLRTVPVAAVTVSVNAGSQLQAISPLTFAADLSAMQPQTVTVQAVDDAVVEGDHNAIISHTVASADPTYNTPGAPFSPADVVTVNIADNDVVYAVVASLAAVLEGNTGSTPITFTLTRTGGVTTTASSVDLAWSGAATLGSDYTVSPSGPTINFGAGQSAATVIVSVSGDLIVEPDEVITLTLTNPAGPGTEYITTGSAQTVITNDDTAGITVGPTSLTVSEPNTTGVFTIGLTSQPTADVTIALSVSDASECSVPASVSLNAGNWRVVSVTVMAVDDSIADGQQTCVVQTGAAASSDPNYAGRDPADVTVAVNDNDSPGIAVSPHNGVTTEKGDSFNLTVMLQTQPTAVVTLTLVSTDTTEGSVSPALLIFTTSDWNVARVVTVTGVNDDVDDDDQAYTIQIDNPTTSDPVYAAINPADVRVINLDDDIAGIVVSAISGNTSEIGAQATFTLALTSQPVATVTVPFTSSDLTEGTVSPTSATFTPAYWNVPQTITVTGVDDPTFDGSVSYAILVEPANSSDQKYNGVDPADVAVTNLDDDRTFVYLPLVMGNYVTAPDLVVERIVATRNNIQVVIKNQGNAPVANEFWVDVYLNPDVAPTHVNQTWNMLGSQGLTWGVTSSALPALVPGGVLTLTLTDGYYQPSYSYVSWPLPAGMPVYAQVDSADALTIWGAVRENHEIFGGPYNNILGPVYVSTPGMTSDAPPEPGVIQDSDHLPPRP